MKRTQARYFSRNLGLFLGCLLGLNPVLAQPAPSEPFAMRGVRLGITLEEFRRLPVINDDGRVGLSTYCTGDQLPRGTYMQEIDPQDQADGIVSCEWFSRLAELPGSSLDHHFIKLGDGAGPPVFDFIESEGERRLFRIRIYANSEYYPAILSALRMNYGIPHVQEEQVQNGAGAVFTSTTSTWSNSESEIVLQDRCRMIDRYCLTYRHGRLGRLYDDLLRRRARAAADRI